MNTSPRALAALRIALLGLLVGWVLFIFGMHASFTSPDSDVTTEAPSTVDFATYFFFGAVAVFGSGALYAKRRAQRFVAEGLPLARPVLFHAVAALIVAITIGAWAVLLIFFDLLVTDYSNLTLRVVNTYLPIVLFTALVVAFLLAGFVFGRAPAGAPERPLPPAAAPAPEPDTRASALAYAIPIIAAAVAALVTGLIYDLTGTSLTAWMWVLVLTLVAGGIIAGTYYGGSLPTSSGAYGLNFAWMIAFTAVGALMAFGYGAAGVHHLHLQSGAGIDAVADSTHTRIDVNGTGLEPRSRATLTLEPAGTELREIAVDNEGWFYEEVGLPEDLTTGDHDLVLGAVAADGSALEATLTFTVSGDEIFIDDAQTAYDSLDKTLPVSWNWLAGRILPAFLLLALVAVVLHTTIPMRARSALVRKNE